MLNIIFIGDINGKIGREAIKKILPELKRELKPDLVIANGENMAHGSGLTLPTVKEMMEAGIDIFTNGDHAFDREKIADLYASDLPVIRPANFAEGVPGKGFLIFEKNGHKFLIINLLGRVFMGMNYDCPFKKLDEILADKNLSKDEFSAIIVDMHAEATSEKIALGHYGDGRVSACLGTHTHVMTADETVTEKGTAFITDVGMVGAADECIGVEKEGIIKTFLTQIKQKHVIPEKGRAIFNSVFIAINPKTKKSTKIKSITKFVEIK